MTENTALNLLFSLLFGSFDTTSSGITAMLKFLTDNPEALRELTVSASTSHMNSFHKFIQVIQ